jgi:hypothetical protein
MPARDGLSDHGSPWSINQVGKGISDMTQFRLGRSASIFVASAAFTGLGAGSAASADIDLVFEDLGYTGFEFGLVEEAIEGSLTNAFGDFFLVEAGVDFTWADDLTVLIANDDLSDVLVQIGGFSDTGASVRYSWPTGAAGEAGTVGGGDVPIEPIDVSGYGLWIGNGYAQGGLGLWTGGIELSGITAVPLPGTLAVFGLAAPLVRRRRA